MQQRIKKNQVKPYIQQEDSQSSTNNSSDSTPSKQTCKDKKLDHENIKFQIARQTSSLSDIEQPKISKNYSELPLTYRSTPEFSGDFEDITLFDIQAKASHNSYRQEKQIMDQALFHEDPRDGGCISVEVDLHIMLDEKNRTQFSIEHDFKPNKKDKQKFFFKEFLHDIRFWRKNTISQNLIKKSQSQRKFEYYEINMLPIIVNIDIKEFDLQEFTAQQVVQEINKEILAIIGKQNIYTPNDMLNNKYTTLIEAVQDEGWPKLQDLLGKFIFTISGNDSENASFQVRRLFTENLKENIGFVDIDSRSIYNNEIFPKLKMSLIRSFLGSNAELFSDLKEHIQYRPNQIFLNQQLKTQLFLTQDLNSYSRIEDNINQAKELKILTRGWQVNEQKYMDLYKNLGINIITTDTIYHNCWTVLNDEYLQENCEPDFFYYL